MEYIFGATLDFRYQWLEVAVGLRLNKKDLSSSKIIKISLSLKDPRRRYSHKSKVFYFYYYCFLQGNLVTR